MIDQLIRPRARAGLRGQARKGVGDLPLFERLAVIAIHVVIAIDDGHMTFRFELLLEAINAVCHSERPILARGICCFDLQAKSRSLAALRMTTLGTSFDSVLSELLSSRSVSPTHR